MSEPTFGWHETDGIVGVGNDDMSEQESLAFLLEQVDAPATTYVHRTYTASGLAAHVRRLTAEVKALRGLVRAVASATSIPMEEIEESIASTAGNK